VTADNDDLVQAYLVYTTRLGKARVRCDALPDLVCVLASFLELVRFAGFYALSTRWAIPYTTSSNTVQTVCLYVYM